MRPIRDYPDLTVGDLEREFADIATLLTESMSMLGRARINHECGNLQHYHSPNAGDTHAARQRFADYTTQNERADVIELEQQVAAYRVNFEILSLFLQARRADNGVTSRL